MTHPPVHNIIKQQGTNVSFICSQTVTDTQKLELFSFDKFYNFINIIQFVNCGNQYEYILLLKNKNEKYKIWVYN